MKKFSTFIAILSLQLTSKIKPSKSFQQQSIEILHSPKSRKSLVSNNCHRKNSKSRNEKSSRALYLSRHGSKIPTKTSNCIFPLNQSASSSSASIIKDKNEDLLSWKNLHVVLSTCTIILIETSFKHIFEYLKISHFPSSLAAFIFMFTSLMISDIIYPFTTNTFFKKILEPGVDFLTRYLTVFITPKFFTIFPIESPGSLLEVLKVSLVLMIGFFTKLLSISFMIKSFSSKNNNIQTGGKSQSTAGSSLTKVKKAPFSNTTVNLYTTLVISTALLTSIMSYVTNDQSLINHSQSLFLLIATLFNYIYSSARFPSHVNKLIHPLLTSTGMTLLCAKLSSYITNQSLQTVLMQSFDTATKVRNGGSILLFFLPPSIVSLGCQVYKQRRLIYQNYKQVISSVLVSSLGGLVNTALLIQLFQIKSTYFRIALLPSHVVSPLLISIMSMLSSQKQLIPLSLALMFLHAFLGGFIGIPLLNFFGISNPVARGLSLGATIHGMGVASLSSSLEEEDSKKALPFAAITLGLTGCFSTLFVSIPFVKQVLLKIAGV